MQFDLNQHLLHFAYMLVAVGLTAIFTLIYSIITPVREWKYIKQGNMACAYSFGGSVIGFSLPIASSIIQNVSLSSFIIWAIIATISQIAVYFFVILTIPNAYKELRANNNAVGIVLATFAISVGIINAASIV